MHVFPPKGKFWQFRQFFFRKKQSDKSLATAKPVDAGATKSVLPQPSKLESPRKAKPINSKSEKNDTKDNNKEHGNKNRKTKRGYGMKNRRKNKTQQINLSIVGTNAAGLKSKQESFST